MVRGQLAAKHGQNVHFSYAGVCLGFAHKQPFAPKVDVSPVQVGQLSDAKPREEERRDQRATVLEPALLAASSFELGSSVERARSVQQRFDLLGAVEPNRNGTSYL